jgi:hypothetical protein
LVRLHRQAEANIGFSQAKDVTVAKDVLGMPKLLLALEGGNS